MDSFLGVFGILMDVLLFFVCLLLLEGNMGC